MLLGHRLLVSLLNSADLTAFYKTKLAPEYFVAGELEIYTFITEHLKSHGTLPVVGTLTEVFGELPSAPEPYTYYLDKVESRFGVQALNKALQKSSDLLKNKDVNGIIDVFNNVTQMLTNSALRSNIIDWVADGSKLVKSAHNMAIMTKDSVKLGWPTLDAMTAGLSGGDILSLCGRPGMGKTFAALWIAYSAYKQGKSVIFLSMEMDPLAICQRLYALNSKLNMSEFKMGGLTTMMKDKLYADIDILFEEEAVNGNFFKIVDGNLSSRVEDFSALLKQFKPDLGVIDGAYLLKHSNPRLDRFNRVAENIESLKQLSGATNVPLVLSYQLNRESTKKKKGEVTGLEDIAYSDAIGQISSVVLGLLQSESTETMEQRQITILKGRNGESGTFDIKWNFKALDFSEVVPVSDEEEVFYS